MPDKRLCKGCNANRWAHQFAEGYRYCKRCIKQKRAYYQRNRKKVLAQIRARRAKDPERTRDQLRAWRKRNPLGARASAYRVPVSVLEDIMTRARGRCEVCRKTVGDRGHFDHCHRSKKVRGYLCHACNTTLGHYEKGWRPGGRVAGFERYLRRFG